MNTCNQTCPGYTPALFSHKANRLPDKRQKKSVVIIDDQPEAIMLVRRYLSAYEDVEVIDECSNGLQAISVINEQKPDWAFIDVQIPGFNGFEVLQRVVHMPRIIFSNATSRFALSAFDHNAVDYLLKPYSWQRFSMAVNKLRAQESNPASPLKNLSNHLQEYAATSRKLFVYQGKKLAGIEEHEIVWLEACDDYTKVHTLNNTYISNTRISNMDQKLPADIFVRIHRSTMVNVQQIKNAYRNSYDLNARLVFD